MNPEKMGQLIRTLRLEQRLTQAELAEQLHVSDKAVSKWERGQGLPDVSLLPLLAQVFHVQLEQLMQGELNMNALQGGNMKKTAFAVCPHCGNILATSAPAEIVCCGKNLPLLTAKPADEAHRIQITPIENEWCIRSAHPQSREHFLSFVALVAGDTVVLRRLYPEWDVETRLPRLPGARVYVYCIRDGLFESKIGR